MVSENEISEDGQQVEFDVDRHTLEELLDTAQKARSRGATVLFRGLRVHSVNEVLQLAAAGGRWQGLVWVS
jgi:hypothetical protein